MYGQPMPMKEEDAQRALLEFIAENLQAARGEAELGCGWVVEQVCRKLGIRGSRDEQVVLTAFYDLFLNGVISFGRAANQAETNWMHVTEHGRKTVAEVSRDPANVAGYLAYVSPYVPAGSVERSYVEEALATYARGCNKATAVMIGAAAEALILDLRDALVARMAALSKPVPKNMTDWRIKTVFDAVEAVLTQHAKAMPRNLAERLDSFASAFVGQLRMSRNDAGHPKSVDPVTREAVHASLLMFPELARLVTDLREWVRTEYA